MSAESHSHTHEHVDESAHSSSYVQPLGESHLAESGILFFMKSHKLVIISVCITLLVIVVICFILMFTHVVRIERFDAMQDGIVTGVVVGAVTGDTGTGVAAGVGVAAGSYAASEHAKGNYAPVIVMGVLGGIAVIVLLVLNLST
jgi:hypothetical protein